MAAEEAGLASLPSGAATVSTDAYDGTRISTSGPASLPLEPASDSTCPKQVPDRPQHLLFPAIPLLVTHYPAVQDKKPESPSTPAFTQVTASSSQGRFLCPPLYSWLCCTTLPLPSGSCSSLLPGNLLPLLPYNRVSSLRPK